MRDHGKRIEALEGHNVRSEPVKVQLVAGPTISASELKGLPPEPWKAGEAVTKIVLVGVKPEAKILPFERPSDGI